MPAPGELVETIDYDDGWGIAIVLATSRHRRRLERADVLEDLLAEAVVGTIGRTELDPFRPALEDAVEFVWRSVTKAELEDESHCCESDQPHRPGDWCTKARGRAWVRLVGLSAAPLYAIDEDLADADAEAAL